MDKIRVVGCGGAFSLSHQYGNQTFALEVERDDTLHRLAFDFGRTAPEGYSRAGISMEEIEAVYVSHLHGDHVGGLEYLGFKRYDWAHKPRRATLQSPILIANHNVAGDLWNRCLAGGMESVEGFVAGLDTYFQVRAVPDNEHTMFHDWMLEPFQQVHVVSGHKIMWSYGLFLSRPGHKTVLITGDTQYMTPRQLRDAYARADLIVQDCELTGVDMSRRAYVFGSNVHASYAELAGFPSANCGVLPPDIRAKMWLSHVSDFKEQDRDFFGNPCDWNQEAFRDGFAGFLTNGMEIEL